MKRERVTKEEVLAAMRNLSIQTYDHVDSVVLETDGTISVVWKDPGGESSSMVDVSGHPEHKGKGNLD